jgi:hypothetical protein
MLSALLSESVETYDGFLVGTRKPWQPRARLSDWHRIGTERFKLAAHPWPLAVGELDASSLLAKPVARYTSGLVNREMHPEAITF